MKIHKVRARASDAVGAPLGSSARPVSPVPQPAQNEAAENPAAQPGDELPGASDKIQQADIDTSEKVADTDSADGRPVEIGGPKGPEPTRYGDWERKGRCVDF